MIERASHQHLDAVTDLALRLWPENHRAEMREEYHALLTKEEAAVFLAVERETPVGFAQCQLRHDYVEGTVTSPVGYLEGIYVVEACRRHGYGRLLLAQCEQWARTMGCSEFASDCTLDNELSWRFHRGTGFAEANRIVCFTKPLGEKR